MSEETVQQESPKEIIRFKRDQKKILLEAARPEGAHAIRFYGPVLRLLGLNLIEPLGGGEPTTKTAHWQLTAQGRELLVSRGWVNG